MAYGFTGNVGRRLGENFSFFGGKGMLALATKNKEIPIVRSLCRSIFLPTFLPIMML
jgi:hypothetical protein